MRLLAFCKVNLDLRILGLRADGYHELRTVLQTIDWADEIQIEPSAEFAFVALGAPAGEENLVVRAVRAFEAITGEAARVRINLTKRVPLGAGLGGGSADAAVTLMGLQRLLNRPIPQADALAALSKIGSDVPFFLSGGRALGVGRGDQIVPLEDGAPSALVVVVPGIQINTREAYSWLTEAAKTPTINGFCAQSVSARWEDDPRNDFEGVVFAGHPVLTDIKEEFLKAGAKRAALSGSGSAVFGVFGSEEEAARALPGLSGYGTAKMVRPLTRAEYQRRIWGVAKW